MPKRKQQPFTWSYSKYSKFKQCAFSYDCKYNKKLPEPKGPGMQRGIDIHELGENYLLGKLKKVPGEYNKVAKEMRKFKKLDAIPEMSIGLTRDFEETEFFASDVWFRGKLDVTVYKSNDVINITDLKTGKIREGEYDDQLEIYGLVAHSIYDVEVINTNLLFIDQGQTVDGKPFHISQYENVKKKWIKKINAMEKTKTFRPNPSWLCRYCHYRKDNGGPCEL